MSPEILKRFESLLSRAAAETDLCEPAAMTLATVGTDGQPSARIVLLRGWDERGFVFYTNTRSRKGREIAQQPRVALCFHWDGIGEQVRIEGRADLVGDDEADAYWQGRPRESQLAAWSSLQSEQLPDPAVLQSRLDEYEIQFANQPVPRPPHWSGYRVTPLRIEFWTNRLARLHERIVYQYTGSEWAQERLYP